MEGVGGPAKLEELTPGGRASGVVVDQPGFGPMLAVASISSDHHLSAQDQGHTRRGVACSPRGAFFGPKIPTGDSSRRAMR